MKTYVDFQKMIFKAAFFALTPLMVEGTRTLDVHECPACKAKDAMIKFVKEPDRRNRIHACRYCGYRKMTPGYMKTNGPFMLVQ